MIGSALMLLHMQRELYNRAHDWSPLRDYVDQNAVDLLSVYRFAGTMAVTPVRFLPGRAFDFADADEGTPAAVIEALDVDVETVVDLVAWPLDQPSRVASAIGCAQALGIDRVRNPASYFGGKPLQVYRTPLGWLQAGCAGVVILSRFSAPDWLGAAPGAIAGEDVPHAREIAKILRGVVSPYRILIPLKEAA